MEWNYVKNGDVKPDDVSVGSGKKVWWICGKCGYEWIASVGHRVNGRGCPYCANKVIVVGKNDLATQYPELIEEWDFEKNAYLRPTDYMENSGKKVWWKCKVCGNSWQTKIYVRTKGHNCPKCSKKSNINSVR